MYLTTLEGASEFFNNFNSLRVPPIPQPTPAEKAELKNYYRKGLLTKQELVRLGGYYKPNNCPTDFNN